MLTTTLYHTFQALYVNQPHGLISYGTHTLIIILKLRPNPDEVVLVQKTVVAPLTTGKSFWEMQAIQKHSSGQLIVMLLSLQLVTLVVLV